MHWAYQNFRGPNRLDSRFWVKYRSMWGFTTALLLQQTCMLNKTTTFYQKVVSESIRIHSVKELEDKQFHSVVVHCWWTFWGNVFAPCMDAAVVGFQLPKPLTKPLLPKNFKAGWRVGKGGAWTPWTQQWWLGAPIILKDVCIKQTKVKRGQESGVNMSQSFG